MTWAGDGQTHPGAGSAPAVGAGLREQTADVLLAGGGIAGRPLYSSAADGRFRFAPSLAGLMLNLTGVGRRRLEGSQRLSHPRPDLELERADLDRPAALGRVLQLVA